MNKQFVILLVGLMFSTGASALVVVGDRGCGVWVKDREEKGFAEGLDKSWLNGFLTGIAVSAQVDFLKDSNAESNYLWIDNYCKTNPLDDLSLAGAKLASELKKRQAP